jgi:methylated-DNA-protein-cysteine methyltransferase related protein
MTLSKQDKCQRIWQVVSQIPAGKVTSYGQVAELAGLPRSARLVGTVLKSLPPNSRLPWHRVIQSKGTLAFPAGTQRYYKQKKRLQDEGITFINERIHMKTYRWQL